MVDTTDAQRAFAKIYSDYLDGHSKWNCLGKGCHNKVDPESADQFCSKGCRAKANSDNPAGNGSPLYRKALAKVQGNWRPAPLDAGLWPRPSDQLVNRTTGKPTDHRAPAQVRKATQRLRQFKFTNPRWPGAGLKTRKPE